MSGLLAHRSQLMRELRDVEQTIDSSNRRENEIRQELISIESSRKNLYHNSKNNNYSGINTNTSNGSGSSSNSNNGSSGSNRNMATSVLQQEMRLQKMLPDDRLLDEKVSKCIHICTCVRALFYVYVRTFNTYVRIHFNVLTLE